jgi:hypothetical protein
VNALVVEQPGPGERRPAAGVQGDDHVELGRDLVQRLHQFGRPLRAVDVGRAVQGGDHVRPVAQVVNRPRGRRVELVQVGDERVDHRVADEVHGRVGPALARQVAEGLGRGGEQQVAELVGQPPVDLLGHGVVEAAQPGLDVRERDAELGARQGGADGGVHVAVKHHQRRRIVEELPFHPHQHVRRLGGLGARPDPEVDVGLGQAELDEEDVGHPLVVVLPGVHHPLLVAERPQGPDNRGRLDEVRPGP